MRDFIESLNEFLSIKVIEAHKAGIRDKDIAKKFNTSKSNVTKILKTYGEYI